MKDVLKVELYIDGSHFRAVSREKDVKSCLRERLQSSDTGTTGCMFISI